MRRIIIVTACLLATAASALGWGRLGHATVAYIAEQNLNPKAKKAINEYLHGRSLVSVASYNDWFKNEMTVDMGDGLTDSKRINTLPHTFEAGEDFTPTRVVNDNGRYVKNCLWFIEKYSNDLQDAAHMDDSTRFADICYIVHALGDMHCPEHIRYYPVDMTIGYFNVTYKGQEIRYHTLWDDQIFMERRAWGFSELAYLVDRYSKKEVKDITEGDIWDWGKDSAANSWPVHSVLPGQKLDKYYVLRNDKLAGEQVAKAGHRLAKLLNQIFG